jgi:5,5'-dehydrodivanillate O-demethylase
MLTPDKNLLLTSTGAGTPMGELLRRHWMPIAGVSEFQSLATKPVRLLGEDLVLYRDLSGNYGLVDRHCPHRRADMSHGMVEREGLRCSYHGWRFGADGACLERPFEEVQAGAQRPLACCGPTWGRSLCRCCRTGSLSRAPTASCRSC